MGLIPPGLSTEASRGPYDLSATLSRLPWEHVWRVRKETQPIEEGVPSP